MRFIVTGSRDWADSTVFKGELRRAVGEAPVGRWLSEDLTIVHGACPTGADAMAHRWAQAHRMKVERYPANWQRYGKAAGPVRNQLMVDAGADLCLAFIKPCRLLACRQEEPHGSHGATSCADMAQLAGIETRIFREDG